MCVQDAIREYMVGYPGDLYEEPFVDFSTTRNFALRVRTLEHHEVCSQFCAAHSLCTKELLNIFRALLCSY